MTSSAGAAPDGQELVRHLVALVMVEEHAVALEFDRVAAGDHVDQQPAVGDPVERRGHARRGGRLLQAGPHGDEEAQPLGQGARAEAITQESSQDRPVGSSTPK